VRAVVFRGEGVVEVAEAPEPVLEHDGDAIVRVRVTGICGTDLHILHGDIPMDPGTTLGHEAAGVVESVGAGVRAVAAGDRVVAAFQIACGTCWFCRAGQTGLCENHRMLGGGPFGGDLHGAQAGYVRIPVADVNLLRIPDNVDDEAAVFVGDVLTTGVYAASLAHASPDDVVAVIGAGPVGACVTRALLADGARHVVVLDRDPTRLDAIAAVGAATVDVGATNPEMALARMTDGRGADVVIDAVGATDAYETTLEIVRRGGRIVIVGAYSSQRVELQLGVAWIRGISLAFAGETPVQALWGPTMERVAAGALDPTPLISHRLPIASAPEAYDLFERRLAAKVVLDPWA
jgi:2-desacetyl-2-hydroxyethyl bacteriochlorophyllide A dehydrogenase